MFLRTDRLFLRPAWLEDVSELTGAIAHEAVATMLARVPWPYREADARAWIAAPRNPAWPGLLVTLPEEGGRVIGGCGLHDDEGRAAVGYWIAPTHWGRGYATEALGGLLQLARLAGHRRLVARHAADNPASGRVLRKAGFLPTGRSRAFHSLGRRADVAAPEYAVDLARPGRQAEAPMPKAA